MGRSDDDRILREMLVPDLDEAVEALGYWLQRHRRLPFYRRSARREAARMIAFWQGRVIAGVPRSPAVVVRNGGALVGLAGATAGYHARRLAARASTAALLVVAAVTALVVLAVR